MAATFPECEGRAHARREFGICAQRGDTIKVLNMTEYTADETPMCMGHKKPKKAKPTLFSEQDGTH